MFVLVKVKLSWGAALYDLRGHDFLPLKLETLKLETLVKQAGPRHALSMGPSKGGPKARIWTRCRRAQTVGIVPPVGKLRMLMDWTSLLFTLAMPTKPRLSWIWANASLADGFNTPVSKSIWPPYSCSVTEHDVRMVEGFSNGAASVKVCAPSRQLRRNERSLWNIS